MIALLLFLSGFWFFMGVFEYRRVTILAKRYNCERWNGCFYYWMFISAGAAALASYILLGQT